MDFDQAGERLDPKIGECHDPFVTGSIDPDEAILLVHFIGDVPQPVLVFAEHLGDAGDGINVVDFVDRRQGQAAAAAIAVAAGVQFQGNSSSRRCAGCAAIRARTSASQA